MSKERGYDLEERLIDYSVRVIRLSEALPDSRAGRHVGGQMLRSGTSPAPNYGEAQAAESRKDFIHKLKIALKELRETNIWLKVIRKWEMVSPVSRIEPLIDETDELIAIIFASIRTAQNNQEES
ncbi:four helix bundle protein [Haloferula sp. A504]|uniref:four helix bundle protein n=1 Tax=Haloferula sp. A504 TaxID=3373601 RepID=UPI0031BEB099|nr:four helix bundle protein [Verrucomicrobiaceae bacterium E54]